MADENTGAGATDEGPDDQLRLGTLGDSVADSGNSERQLRLGTLGDSVADSGNSEQQLRLGTLGDSVDDSALDAQLLAAGILHVPGSDWPSLMGDGLTVPLP